MANVKFKLNHTPAFLTVVENINMINIASFYIEQLFNFL